ncbi:MAG: hypothetical protein KKB53_01680, partial [Acidobacteria bacterium]|nr:hypothetical protein [Acidobacteriota bacterium]
VFDSPFQIHYIVTIMTGFLRILIFGVLFYLIFKIIQFFQNIRIAARNEKKPEQLSGIMIKDETCNTYLPREDAIRELVGGKEFFFCSRECRDTFLQKTREKKT